MSLCVGISVSVCVSYYLMVVSTWLREASSNKELRARASLTGSPLGERSRAATQHKWWNAVLLRGLCLKGLGSRSECGP